MLLTSIVVPGTVAATADEKLLELNDSTRDEAHAEEETVAFDDTFESEGCVVKLTSQVRAPSRRRRLDVALAVSMTKLRMLERGTPVHDAT